MKGRNFICRVINRLKRMWDNRRWGYMGDGSRLIKPMRIINRGHIYIGDNCFFLNSARLEAVKHKRGQGRLHIDNNTSFQQCCHIIAADELVIGNDCVFSAFVYVSDCSHPYAPNIDIATGELDIRPTKIGNHCFIGIGACIMPGVVVGDYSVIGANAVVCHDVPPYSMVGGVPARILKKYNLETKRWERI